MAGDQRHRRLRFVHVFWRKYPTLSRPADRGNEAAGRYVLLSKLEETLIIGERRFDLSCNLYPGVVHPQGFQYLRSFVTDPFPQFVYRIEDIVIEKRVFMIDGENTTIIEYEIKSDLHESARLELRPLIAFRDYHSTTHANGSLNAAIDEAPSLVSLEPYPGLPRLYLAHNASKIEAVGTWYFNLEYSIERERGLDYREDLFCPFAAVFDLTQTRNVALIASTKPHDISMLDSLRGEEIARRKSIRIACPCDDPLIATLFAAADQFIVKCGDRYSAIAGYHWFSDWGRDTMISLPGLTLVTVRHHVAKGILLACAAHIDQRYLRSSTATLRMLRAAVLFRRGASENYCAQQWNVWTKSNHTRQIAS